MSNDEPTLYCTVHPNRPTRLRCNKCGRPMCTDCAVATPVGYRCKECVRQHKATFYNATVADYLVAGAVAFALSLILGNLLVRLGLLMILFLGIPLGGLISEAIFRAISRRRGRYIWAVAGGAILIGILPSLWPVVYLSANGNAGAGFSPIAPLLYIVIVAGTVIARFRVW